MRVVILTSSLYSMASLCLPIFSEDPEVDVAMVIYSEGRIPNRRKHIKRRIKKILRVGVMGAINGIRMRQWYGQTIQQLGIERLDRVAERLGIRFERVPYVNSPETVGLFVEADAQLGLSLGNGYIGQKVFSIPQYGMLNIHHELLPKFQGAQSIIWQIYEGSHYTGYSIHQIDRHIDTGDILYQEKIPIEFKSTLSETIMHNHPRLIGCSINGLMYVLHHYDRVHADAKAQVRGRSFTTPSLSQYIRMVRLNKLLYNRSLANSRPMGDVLDP